MNYTRQARKSVRIRFARPKQSALERVLCSVSILHRLVYKGTKIRRRQEEGFFSLDLPSTCGVVEVLRRTTAMQRTCPKFLMHPNMQQQYNVHVAKEHVEGGS